MLPTDGQVSPAETRPEWQLADEPAASVRRTWSTAASGMLLSLVFHLWLLGSFAQWMLEQPWRLDPEPLETRFLGEAEPIPEPLEVVEYELADPHDRELPQQTTVNAASLGATLTDRPKQEMAPEPLLMLDPTRMQRPMFDIPEGLKVSDTVVVPGTTGEGLVQLDAALDRITVEIARHLQERRVLLVWLLDSSGSIVPQRTAIARRLKRVYGELQALEQQDQFALKDRPLLTGVVAFGQGTQFLIKDPTDSFPDVQRAFDEAPTDPSGVENVFTAVNHVMDRWRNFRVDHGRRILIVTLTDEAGDDHGVPLDTAIAKCRRYGAVGYVVGPASPFGRRQGFVPYVAPEDGQTYQLPIDLGPESAVVETIDLPFWYDGPQYENLSSGYGPYALSRFVRETGGVYFLTNMTTMAGLATVGSFEPAVMKAFEPDYRYGSAADVLKDLTQHPLRAAVYQMAMSSQTAKLRAAGTPNLSFVLQPGNFRRVLDDAQKSAAISQLAIERILSQLPPSAEKAYASEPSPRWRLCFSLNYGRLLAQKVRALEYNTACAQLKSSYTDADIANKVNRPTFRPDREVNYAIQLRKPAQLAEEHLRRVLNEAPGTPWAILAARELKDGFGIRVIERYVPPPPPAPPGQPAPPRPRPKFAPEPQTPQQPKPPPPKPVLPRL